MTRVPRTWLLRSMTGLVATAVAAVSVVMSGITPALAASTAGIDVSHHQGTINWTQVHGAGVQFAYIKATEGSSVSDSAFDTNYVAAYNAGVIRGAYHFALPDRSSGTTQADYLVANGGAWSADGRTLPAAVDLEPNPYGASCYGKSQSAMRTWITEFLNRYRTKTGRYAVIYTSTSWWTSCTGNYAGFWSHHPLWLARWASSAGTLPSGASVWSFWQYTASGSVAGISGNVDRDYWNGTRARLVALADNT
jgi:GH25 family lysozyme M1 (1,4-beta-N-acetylmuramidase)